MACGVVMVHDGRWWPHVFPVPFSKSSARLPYIFFSTVYPSTAVLIDYSTLLQYGVLVLGMYQDISDSPTTLEVDFYTISSADVFAWFCQSFHVGYHNEWFVVVAGPLVSLLFLLYVSSIPGPHRIMGHGSIPFLDCLVTPQADGSIVTAVYRKPTHTDMYLHWDSYHHLAAKYSVINTLRHRAKTVCTTKQLLEKEENHLFTALRRCKYPVWAWNRTNIQKKKKTNQGASNNNKSFIVVPYMKGLAESCKNICRRYGVEVYFKGGRTIRDILVHPKDKDTILKKSGVIYKYSCGRVDCGEEYIGESGRTFGERYREHMRSPSPIMDHHNTTGHEVSLENFTIVGREDNNIARNIREAIFIRVNDPSLNRNIGKFQLPHIWDEVLAKSPELHLK